MTQRNNDSLAVDLFKITFYGIVLIAIQRFFEHRVTSENILVTTSFLAVIAIFKFLFPFKIYDKHAWLRMCCVAMCCCFSWYLIYAAENTRATWYRLNVQRHKIESFVSDTPFYVVLSDSDGLITCTSRNIELLTGWKPGELVGQPITVLMLDGPSAKYQIVYDKAIDFLRNPYGTDKHWLSQGLVKAPLKHKNGNFVPILMFSGGIRWSTDIQFKGDIDMFAVYFPVDPRDALVPPTNLRFLEGREIQGVPMPPPVEPMVPMPSSTPTIMPQPKRDGEIVKPKSRQ